MISPFPTLSNLFYNIVYYLPNINFYTVEYFFLLNKKEMERLQTVCNVIIIVGGAIMAIKNVAEWFGKPIRLFKKRSDDNFDEKVVTIIKREMPALFYEHDLKIRDQYRADREQYLKDITAEVIKNIKGELNQVHDLTLQYETLCISAKDVLREKIMQLYFKNKKDKTLSLHEKEALDQYYVDYKAIKGNSYIDKYYNRMKLWQVIDDDEED
jgi:hypothetical protein